MTREEAREWLRSIKDEYIHGGDEAFDNARREALDMAVKALEQEPILNKIRAEIKEWYWQADKQALAKDPCVVDAMVDLFIRTIGKAERNQQPCDDAVSRDLMTNTLGATCIAKRDEKGDLVALCSIDHLPSVTPRPRTGYWIHIGNVCFEVTNDIICKCSECGGVESFTGKFELEGHRLVIDMDRVYKFCPYCGAKMEDKK